MLSMHGVILGVSKNPKNLKSFAEPVLSKIPPCRIRIMAIDTMKNINILYR